MHLSPTPSASSVSPCCQTISTVSPRKGNKPASSAAVGVGGGAQVSLSVRQNWRMRQKISLGTSCDRVDVGKHARTAGGDARPVAQSACKTTTSSRGTFA